MTVRSEPHQRFAPSSSVHTRVFDDELVILDLASGEYLALDAVGTALWNGVQEGRSLDQIASDIVEEYEVTHAQVVEDLRRLLEELVHRGLLRSLVTGDD